MHEYPFAVPIENTLRIHHRAAITNDWSISTTKPLRKQQTSDMSRYSASIRCAPAALSIYESALVSGNNFMHHVAAVGNRNRPTQRVGDCHMRVDSQQEVNRGHNVAR